MEEKPVGQRYKTPSGNIAVPMRLCDCGAQVVATRSVVTGKLVLLDAEPVIERWGEGLLEFSFGHTMGGYGCLRSRAMVT
jgi:hypothetical protein